MKSLSILALAAIALSVGACSSKTAERRTALTCPLVEGHMKRTGASADGRTCTYLTPRGGEVTVQLVSVTKGVEPTLSAIEDSLVPAANPTGPEATTPKPVADAGADSHHSATVKVEIGGKPPAAKPGGESTNIDLPGLHIVADDHDDSADVQVGSLKVKAGGETVTVRNGPRDVRLRGEALNPERRGVRASFVYHGQNLPNGYRFVGYEAGGPKAGPLTVAVVRSRKADADRISGDVVRLVRLNGGV